MRMRQATAASTLFLSFLLSASSARALTQPDGKVIPTDNTLQDIFNGRGESINAVNDAQGVPETFVPSCALTFEVISKEAGFSNSFGWYNVVNGAPGDLHEFLSCSDPVGTVKTLMIKTDPGYLGGEIGFYEATGPCGSIGNHENIFYSQRAFNPEGNYYHLIVYNSTTTPKAFYFGWEDVVHGDDDFDDLATFVTGISCSGGGAACETGLQGQCAAGAMQCQNGVLTCVQSIAPSNETCDGIDNDCNGAVDDGDLCDDNEVCDKGVCVPACGGGEFVCKNGTVCNGDGYCVDPACEDVDCPPGTKCIGGDCVSPCDGIVCPHGQACFSGVCKDPCSLVQCDAEQICVDGICSDPCTCGGCPAGQVCQNTAKCAPAACAMVGCDADQYCDESGACVDKCKGAKCPEGGECVAGECQPGEGTSAASGPGQGGGGPMFGTGGAGADGGAGPAGAGGTASSSAGSGPGVVDKGACGCRLPGNQGDAPLAPGVLATLMGLAFVTRRSSKRK